jgi:hypothetical protein
MTMTDTTQESAPLAPPGVIYQYRALSNCGRNWRDIASMEELSLIKGLPDIYVVRALSEVPLDDLLRAPAATVSAAVATIAQARRDRDVIAGQLRRAMAALEGMP